MKKRTTVLQLLVMVVLIFLRAAGADPAAAAPHRSATPTKRSLVDVRPFEVAGFKLGMTPEEVISVMKQMYISDDERINYCFSNSCWEGNIDAAKLAEGCADSSNDYDGRGDFNFTTKEIRVSIEFVRDFRVENGKCQVYKISSWKSGGFIEERDAGVFRSAVIAKYGLPTFGSPESYSWCGKIRPALDPEFSPDACDQDYPFLEIGLSEMMSDEGLWQTAVSISGGDVVGPIKKAWLRKKTPPPAMGF